MTRSFTPMMTCCACSTASWRASLGGGLGYSEDHLRTLWDKAPFSLRVLRQITKTDGQGPCFGEDFLWTLLATKEILTSRSPSHRPPI